MFLKIFPSDNPRQNLLSQTTFFRFFDKKIAIVTILAEIFTEPPSPQVNVVFLDSRHLLQDMFQVREIINIDLGGERGVFILYVYVFLFCDKGFGEDCLRSSECGYACLGM